MILKFNPENVRFGYKLICTYVIRGIKEQLFQVQKNQSGNKGIYLQSVCMIHLKGWQNDVKALIYVESYTVGHFSFAQIYFPITFFTWITFSLFILAKPDQAGLSVILAELTKENAA